MGETVMNFHIGVTCVSVLKGTVLWQALVLVCLLSSCVGQNSQQHWTPLVNPSVPASEFVLLTATQRSATTETVSTLAPPLSSCHLSVASHFVLFTAGWGCRLASLCCVMEWAVSTRSFSCWSVVMSFFRRNLPAVTHPRKRFCFVPNVCEGYPKYKQDDTYKTYLGIEYLPEKKTLAAMRKLRTRFCANRPQQVKGSLSLLWSKPPNKCSIISSVVSWLGPDVCGETCVIALKVHLNSYPYPKNAHSSDWVRRLCCLIGIRQTVNNY